MSAAGQEQTTELIVAVSDAAATLMLLASSLSQLTPLLCVLPAAAPVLIAAGCALQQLLYNDAGAGAGAVQCASAAGVQLLSPAQTAV